MAIKSDMTKIGKRFNATKNVSSTRGNTFLLATSLLTVGCKSSERNLQHENTISQSEDNTVSIILSEDQNYSELTSVMNYYQRTIVFFLLLTKL